MPATSRPKLTKLGDSFRLEVVDDGQMKVEGMTTINFEIKGQFYEWEMYLVHMRTSGLLGLDFLCHHNYVLTADTLLVLNGRTLKCEWEIRCPGNGGSRYYSAC